MASRLQDVILRGLSASQPLATDVAPGTLYYSTDLFFTERSNGAIWESYADDLPLPANVALKDQNNVFTGINSLKVVYSPLFDNGLSGAAKNIDWNNGINQYLELDAACTITFSNGLSGARLVLIIKTNGFAIVWPIDVEWPASTPPTLSLNFDLTTFMYVGLTFNKYVGAANTDYSL